MGQGHRVTGAARKAAPNRLGGSMTRREQIAALALAGLSDREIAAGLRIGKRRVRDLIRAARADGVDVPRAADRRTIVSDGDTDATAPR